MDPRLLSLTCCHGLSTAQDRVKMKNVVSKSSVLVAPVILAAGAWCFVHRSGLCPWARVS